MIKRKKTKKISIGNVEIGGLSPIVVQSMTNTDTADVQSTVAQIKELEEVGCEVVRVAVPTEEASQAIKEIKQQINIPLVADIHFDYRLAIASIENGADAVRINPGNIGKEENVKAVVDAAKKAGISIRVGVNSGSLEKEYEDFPVEKAMVKSVLKHVKTLEKMGFYDIKISLKSSDVQTMIDAYKKIAKKTKYPLHVGVTEAGTLQTGLIKSAIGIGALLQKGIGDTIRVSLTDNPVEEVKAAYEILRALGLRQQGVNFISCPTCGRCKINLIPIAKEIQKRLPVTDKQITVAVMGCGVNGPGEAKHADIGLACAKKEALIFKKGEVLKKVKEEDMIEEFLKEYESLL